MTSAGIILSWEWPLMGAALWKTGPAPVRNEDEEASPLPGADAGQGAACACEGSHAHTLGT